MAIGAEHHRGGKTVRAANATGRRDGQHFAGGEHDWRAIGRSLRVKGKGDDQTDD
jgi:hypothetical protein